MIHCYAVIGHPVGHSLSPLIHQEFAKQAGISLQYGKIEGDASNFEKQVADFFYRGGQGLNVTLPFKERAFAMADKATKRCRQAKAANTLWMMNERLQADNTDGIGLVRDLLRYTCLQGRKMLVLGAGGAARGIIPPLLDAAPERLVVANRSLSRAEGLKKDFPAIDIQPLDELDFDAQIVINATAVSLAKENIPFSPALFFERPFCYDLAYSASGLTAFVAHARTLGCQAVDGLGMLVEQAAEAFKIWHGLRPDSLPILNKMRAGQDSLPRPPL